MPGARCRQTAQGEERGKEEKRNEDRLQVLVRASTDHPLPALATSDWMGCDVGGPALATQARYLTLAPIL